jgi:hypothetical protein
MIWKIAITIVVLNRLQREENLQRVAPWRGCGLRMDWLWKGGQRADVITESIPSTRISTQLDLVKPFAARNTNEFVLKSTNSALGMFRVRYSECRRLINSSRSLCTITTGTVILARSCGQ